MILPMKKVSILVQYKEKERAMRKLRRLGLIHIDARGVSGDKLSRLKDQTSQLETAIQTIREVLGKEKVNQDEVNPQNALTSARAVIKLADEKKSCYDRKTASKTELERLAKWGEVDPKDIRELKEKGISLSLYEVSSDDLRTLREDKDLRIIVTGQDKKTTRLLLVQETGTEEGLTLPPGAQRVALPVMSTKKMRNEIEKADQRIEKIDQEIRQYAGSIQAMEKAAALTKKEAEFESYLGGMERASLTDDPGEKKLSVAMLQGYIPTEDLDKLKAKAKEQAWGIVAEDPTEEDNVPTKLRNNKFVSLIYPLTDFLDTVPGYFEQDISGWFLAFMLIFFGIIFGDGGYGLLIAGVAVALIIKAKMAKKEVPPLYYLLGLFGGATIIWGLLTCTWFGLEPSQIPGWLQKLSLPVISNVNENHIWYPFWTNGEAGLTTPQNVQIFCFTLALIQLAAAHVLGMIRNKNSLKLLGELGSLMQIIGMFYVVLAVVVNGEVFGLSQVISGIPVGSISLGLVAVGFVLSFIFASYEGSIIGSILDSLKNIITILLGVVNVFSDIVSYIRLWAVGLAGAAISSTVNEMAGPMFGRLAFIIFAIILLVFGHGLNMILNTLSVIVHGVRLNTLEFSSHVGINWSGHKYDPFKE